MWREVWLHKCIQIQEKASIALSGDQRTKQFIADIVINEQASLDKEKKQHITTLCVVPSVIIAAVLIVWVISSGIGVRVPDSAEIAPESIRITGSFDGYLKPADICLIRPSDSGKELELTFKLTALKDFQAARDAAIDKFKKDKGWGKDNVTVELASVNVPGLLTTTNTFSVVKVGGLSVKDPSGGNFINSVSNIPKGETKTVVFLLPMSKRDMAPFMAKKTLEIYLKPFYRLENNSASIFSVSTGHTSID
jgi:hypothetical protein